MNYLGIDFGTTNTLSGVVDDHKKLKLVPLEADMFEMPSAIFLKVKNRSKFEFNEDAFERRVSEVLQKDKRRWNDENNAVSKRLEDFSRANAPRIKQPKPYDFRDSDKYMRALHQYQRDKSDFPKIIKNFEETRLREEEIRIRQSITPLKTEESIRKQVRAKMEQELVDDELELIENQTFFTALSDPETVKFYGQRAIEEYKNDPMSGFFMRSPKAFLGVSLADAHKELFVRIVALVLSEVKSRSEKYLGEVFEGVVLGRPVNYMGAHSNLDNQQALNIMRKAAQLAGFVNIHFIVEPMAASLVISRAMFDSNAPALIVDIGGGTTDVVLLGVDLDAEERLSVINSVGERVGGNDFDEILAKKKFSSFMGGDEKTIDGRQLPNQLIMDALSTRDIHKQASFRKRGIEIHEMISKVEDPSNLERLYQIFQMQLQHQVLMVSEDVKKKLSESDFCEIDFSFFRNPFSIDLHSNELPDIYATELNSIKRNILNAYNEYLSEGQSFRVFLTGGMAKCSALVESIKEFIPKGTVINRISALQSVVAGLSVAARQLSLSEDAHADNFSVRGIPVTR